MSVAGSRYNWNPQKPTARAAVLEAVCSVALAELNDIIPEGHALVLPQMYKRTLKRLTP